jgi:hypothetical protein
MRKQFALPIAALLIATSSQAQWSQEPEKVLGVRLGAAVPDAAPYCPATGSAQNTCLVRPDARMPPSLRIITRVRGTPDIGIRHAVPTVRYVNDRVHSLTIDTDHAEWKALKALLIERYGPPSETEQRQVVAGSGAMLGSETLTWTGTKVSIFAWERSGRVDQSSAMFVHNQLALELERQKREATRAGAGRL